MLDTDMIQLWKSYSLKLEETLLLNRKNAEDLTRIKVSSFLASMRPIKIFTVLTGIVWVLFVDAVIIGSFHAASPFFIISAIIQSVLTKLAIGIYLYQLIIIQTVAIDDPIVEVQEKLAKLKASTLWVTRFLFLQLPVWTTFYLSMPMLKAGGVGLFIQVMVTAVFTYVAYWLFVNIKMENRHRKWFRIIFEGREWTPLMKAMDILQQLRDYKPEPDKE